MKIPQSLFLAHPIYKDERGGLELLHCPTSPFFNVSSEYNTSPTQVLLSKTNPYTGRGLHFQKKHPLFQVISVIDGEITECLVQRKNKNGSLEACSQKIKSTDKNNTFMVPAGWAHGFYTLEKPATLLYLVWGERRIEDESGLNLKSTTFNFLDKSLKNKIELNERDAEYEYI
jgi:dTDP-4-dehydrorhamnose 3,5-epimerase